MPLNGGVADGVHNYNFNYSFIFNHCDKQEINRPLSQKCGLNL
nr:MAG TPA: hypothetical protein [Caudoviricetes sp.]